MKLEATDARRPDEITAATIEDIRGPLLWIKLDHDPSFKMVACHNTSMYSFSYLRIYLHFRLFLTILMKYFLLVGVRATTTN